MVKTSNIKTCYIIQVTLHNSPVINTAEPIPVFTGPSNKQ